MLLIFIDRRGLHRSYGETQGEQGRDYNKRRGTITQNLSLLSQTNVPCAG